MFGIIATNMVTCNYVVIHIFQHTAKSCSEGMKLLAQILSVTGELFCFINNLVQAAASVFHEYHAAEQIGNNRIIAHGAECISSKFKR